MALPPQSSRSKYPGMRPREGQVFRLWLQQHESEYDRFDYNVRVGPGRDPGPAFDAATRQTAIASSQLRLDAVGWRAGVPTLIEIKDYALVLAVAQLTRYAAVWRLWQPQQGGLALLIICSNHEPAFLPAAAAAGVAVDILPPH